MKPIEYLLSKALIPHFFKKIFFNFYITSTGSIFTTLPVSMKKFLLISFFSLSAAHVLAQDTLPKVSVTQLGRKVLVSWVNPFETVTAINIQRSGDSLKNFISIGSVLNVNAQANGFVDTKEFIPSNQYYRLFISFAGGNYIFTESHRPAPDTMNISPQVTEQPVKVQTWFVPSRYVYTGKDNNVIIFLPDAKKRKYSIRFYEDDGIFIFELKHVPETYLTIDKVNFNHSGLFRFELYDNKTLVEKHKLYIPKDGKAAPSLDVNGYEISK